jgi:hypothetical protein
MNTKIIMIATLAVSAATFAATVIFGARTWNKGWIAANLNLNDEETGLFCGEEGFNDDEE